MARRSTGRTPELQPNKYGATPKGNTFRFVRQFLDNQIEPSFTKLYDENFDEKLKLALRNYLIISLVSTMEYFFRNEARRIVDKYDKDIRPLFPGQILPIPISSLDQLIREKSITKGNIVASSFNFVSLDDINKLFSRLLELDFFDYVRKLERSNPSRYVFRGHGPPIDIDIKKLLEAFSLRHQVVHEMRQVEISNWQLVSRWDNAMNIMDAAVAMFDPKLRKDLDEAVERQTRKDIGHKNRPTEQNIT